MLPWMLAMCTPYRRMADENETHTMRQVYTVIYAEPGVGATLVLPPPGNMMNSMFPTSSAVRKSRVIRCCLRASGDVPGALMRAVAWSCTVASSSEEIRAFSGENVSTNCTFASRPVPLSELTGRASANASAKEMRAAIRTTLPSVRS